MAISSFYYWSDNGNCGPGNNYPLAERVCSIKMVAMPGTEDTLHLKKSLRGLVSDNPNLAQF